MDDHVDAIRDGAGDMRDARSQPRARVIPTMSEADFMGDHYKMGKRGKALIINNKNFLQETGMRPRKGTDVDRDKMRSLLSTMKFTDSQIHELNDATRSQMTSELLKVGQAIHEDSSCFVCVILSYGEEGFVYGTDGKIPLDQLLSPLKGHKCPTLAGKPKLFFIQACHGTEPDSQEEVADCGGMELESDNGEEIVWRKIPTEADFLMAYSLVPGDFSWRSSSENASWFIQAIVDVFTQHWTSMDILTMMTRVNKKVAKAGKEFKNREKQIPCITSMLTKNLYFYK